MKVTYVSIGKPLKFHKCELYEGLIGWYRIDILKRKLKEDKEFKSKFTERELKKIEEVAE